ncbi:MAG: DEAD/DEAH box helicase, partial [Desulfobacterales bacterium]|nr:DEAD/DEAH box helicase [Desulfobacterales bacterium]
MDVFRLRDSVVDEYRQYVESFVRVLDPRINQFVREQLEAGELWPDAVLQLNPAFVMDKTLAVLADEGIITRETAHFFGQNIQLYRHQREALDIAQRGEPYVVTTGTGSGKSLTYLVPIHDFIVRTQPQNHSVRAIIVYPMNALINSQLDTLKSYASGFPESPVRFDRYTGQEREEDRARILADPPHILLTNYVMLEYLLVRPTERSLLATATRDLRFLVMDELHFYRGRQGADVAMLLRRVQQRAGHDLQVVGTSATMTTQGTRDERRLAVADVGTRLFGVTVPASNVIDETLQRVARVSVPTNQHELRQAVEAEPPAPTIEAVTNHPLSAWVEEAFGLATEEGRLVRREPETFANAVARLARETGIDINLCTQRLRAVLDAGNLAYLLPAQPIFAFRLHQFLSSGSSVYATLEPPDARHLTMEGQYKADEERVLF